MSTETTAPAQGVSALRQLVLQAAIEHGAARWAAVPGVGRGGSARYIWETEGRLDKGELEWVVAYLGAHPQVFDLPLDGSSATLHEHRVALSKDADTKAFDAWKAGNLAEALALIDQAEALHPNPGSHFAHARKVLTDLAAKPGDDAEPDTEPEEEPTGGDVEADEWQDLADELGGVA